MWYMWASEMADSCGKKRRTTARGYIWWLLVWLESSRVPLLRRSETMDKTQARVAGKHSPADTYRSNGNTLVLSPFQICRHRCAHLHRDGHVDLQLVHCAGILPQRDGSVRLRGPAVSRLVPRERCYKGSVVAACVLHAAVLCCWRLLLVLPTAVLHLLSLYL